ncbi:MAG: hypothetical protein M3P41_03020 [Actinomycetota bacterium]|nr:hypothetical protein [Actinomycetota bacterium]
MFGQCELFGVVLGVVVLGVVVLGAVVVELPVAALPLVAQAPPPTASAVAATTGAM